MCIVIIIGQGYSCIKPEGIDWSGLIASYIGIPLFLSLYIGYKIKHKTKLIPLHKVDLTYGGDENLDKIEEKILELN